MPLESNALALRYAVLRPGPELTMERQEGLAEGAQGELMEAPSRAERRLRATVAELVAAQAVEDAAEVDDPPRRGHHAYNAVLKRVLGKGRAEITLAELEAAVAWLGRNRLRDYMGLLDVDARYALDAGRHQGGWTPPIGRTPKARSETGPARLARRCEE